MSRILDGKSVLITGGGSGIGRATALAAVREGAAVIVADISEAGAEETAALVRSAGGEALAVRADVTDESQVASLCAAADEAFGGLDCAFNNAGVARGRGWVPGTLTAGTSFQAWRDVMSANIDGVFLCLREELKIMTGRGSGAIVNTASVAGLIGLAGAAPYSASKHAVVGLTKSAAMEYAGSGIRINALCPGYITTPMTDSSAAGAADVHAARIARTPLGRYGLAEEVAEMVVWLLSDRASYCTGSSFTVGGGIESG